MGAQADPGLERIQRLRRLFEYDAWANREALASLRSDPPPPAKAVEVLAHVLGSGSLWLDRLLGAERRLAVWPTSTLEELQEGFDALERRFEDYLEDLAPADLERTIEYVNSKGEPWRSTVGDVLTHVLLHASYHRGQVASHLRGAGVEPAYTDFVHAVRQGLVD